MKKWLMKMLKIPEVQYIEVPIKGYIDPSIDIMGGRVNFHVERCLYGEWGIKIQVVASIHTSNVETEEAWLEKLKNNGFVWIGAPYVKTAVGKYIRIKQFDGLVDTLKTEANK